jgi:hypothetical protein
MIERRLQRNRLQNTAFRLRGILSMSIFLLAGCQGEKRSVHLSFDYQPGESYTYEMYDDVVYETTSGDGEVTRVTHNQTQITKIKVLEPDSSNHLYNLLVSFVVTADTFIYPENYTGKKEQRSKSLIGRISKYTLAMRHDGEIVHVNGKDEMATEYYESAYKTRQPVFPKKAIKPGYKWKHTIYLSIPGNEPIPVVIKYKFAGYEKVDAYDCAVIEYFSTFTKNSDLTATKWNKKDQFKQWLAKYQTRSQGKLYFAYDYGIVAKTEATITMDTEYSIIEKDGTPSEFMRKTIDVERLKLVSVKRDSLYFSTNKIIY